MNTWLLFWRTRRTTSALSSGLLIPSHIVQQQPLLSFFNSILLLLFLSFKYRFKMVGKIRHVRQRIHQEAVKLERPAGPVQSVQTEEPVAQRLSSGQNQKGNQAKNAKKVSKESDLWLTSSIGGLSAPPRISFNPLGAPTGSDAAMANTAQRRHLTSFSSSLHCFSTHDAPEFVTWFVISVYSYWHAVVFDHTSFAILGCGMCDHTYWNKKCDIDAFLCVSLKCSLLVVIIIIEN